MKKNKIMRLASVLLIAVLLSTSIISGTFAKYVTTGSVSDTARVAKFGVVIEGSGNLFSATYKKVSNGNGPSTFENDGTNIMSLTVESHNGTDKVVAPGTKNDHGLKLDITGAPEVDVKITLSVDAFKDIFLKANAGGSNYPDMTTSDKTDTFTFYNENGNADYHPVLFTLKTGDGASVFEGLTLADMQAFLETYEVYVDANTDLSAAKYSYTLSWEWKFEGPYSYEASNGDKIVMNKKKVDQADTLLGDIMAVKMGETYPDAEGNPTAGYNPENGNVALPGIAGYQVQGTDYSTDISVSLSLTVTQVD